MNHLLLKSLVLLGLYSGCASRTSVQQAANTPEVAIAFPGAEGFGKYTTGGRGGKVHIVSNLDDSGPGSLRDALGQKGKKIVVFAISGTIHLESALSVKGDVTIAGQSAPGDGICIADYPVSLSGDNIIIRFIRFRLGDRFQNGGMVDGSGHDDALSGARRKHIIIDHCSISWSTDEVMSIYAGDSTTIQWNMLAEPLNYSYHFEKGDTAFEKHGFGGIWGGKHLTAHHNLIAHCVSRTPRFDGIRNAPEEFVDFGNNVIYNWGSNNIYAGEGGRYNIINNYMKPGPATNKKVASRIANPWKNEERKIPFGSWYVSGNYVYGSPDVTGNNALGIHFEKGTEQDKATCLIPKPYPSACWDIQPAAKAYQAVLTGAGAIFPVRDTLDARIVQEVEKGTGRIIDVQGGLPHGTPYEQSKNAWPALKSAPPLPDTDRDGMPDAWEDKHGLNKADGSDAAGYTLSKVFTNIEMYLNGLIERK
jgi:pectate lyase